MSYYADIAVSILILMTLAVSLNLLLGYAGRVSMAHAIFFGIGGFTAARLTLPTVQDLGGVVPPGTQAGLGWSWFPALVVAMVVAFLAALLISIPAVRLVRGEYLILLTLAFQLVTNQLMGVVDSVTGGPYGLSGIPPLTIAGTAFFEPEKFVWVMALAAALAIGACWALGESPFGRLLKGLREHESAVASVGKSPVRPELLAFSISASIAGGVGALAAFYYGSVVPSTFSLTYSILIVSVVVLGGIGNLGGTILGAIVLGGLEPLLRQYVGDSAIPWQAVIYGAALVVMMRLRPEGILPEGRGLGPLLRRIRKPPITTVPTPEEALGRLRHVDNEEAPGAPPILLATGLQKSFGGLKAVNGATFALPRGQITALIGPNGAGKTTIFNMICGTIAPDQGQVHLRGDDVTGRATYKVARLGLARSFQDVRVCQRLTALDNVALGVPDQPGEQFSRLLLTPRAVRRAERAVRASALDCLALLGIADRADVLVSELSYGDQKLVAIARLLATGCDVLLLDEPTSGVDPASVEKVINGISRLRDLGHTVCLVEHSVHFVQRLADRAVFLDQGTVIAEGTVDDLIGRRELAELYFGT